MHLTGQHKLNLRQIGIKKQMHSFRVCIDVTQFTDDGIGLIFLTNDEIGFTLQTEFTIRLD